MSGTPTVSVVMAVKDPHPRYFPDAVRSILEQTLSDLELIIIEAASPRSARATLEREGLLQPRVRHERLPDPTTLTDQRNRALELARAPLVAVADADDISLPDRLARQRDAMVADPDLVVLGGALTVIDEHDRVVGARDYPTDGAAITRALRRYNPLAQPAVMLRRDAVLAVGGYTHRDHGAMAEDYDLWCRLARGGARLANLEAPLVRYRVHADAAKARRLRDLLRATIAIKRRHWSDAMDPGDRLRLMAEQALLWLPPPLVWQLFRRVTYRRPHHRR